MSLTMESSHVGLLQQNLSQEPSKSPSPQPTDSTPEQPNIDANLSAILNATKSSTVPMVKVERTPSPEQENKGFEKELEAQQKAFQRFTTSLNDLGIRPPFPINVLPPFLAALQQNPLTIHQQLLSMTAQQCSDVSPDLDDDDDPDNLGSTEPEDLTIGLRKEKKDVNADDNADSDISGQQNWSYEEQFKQLYELSDDVKRKEWLDDWLGFMHRIGKPVTRIPIMAKQVLDLYELYRLVVQHGGLVEIINKKLWREITKGLNLPSSITSAAFTLRTQYQKFLYEYECEKEGLSNPADLQQAIDGNRREGRRSTSNDSALGPSASQQAAFVAAYRAEQIAALQAHQRQLEKAQRAAVEAVSRQTFHASVSGRESTSSVDSDGTPVKRPRRSSESKNDAVEENSSGVMHEQSTDRLFDAIPSAHLKITSRGGTNSTKSSLVVSMEINGIMYQGVLFALNPTLQAVAQEDSASDPGDSSSIANSLKITL